jgi:GGDEF domain-containing protein
MVVLAGLYLPTISQLSIYIYLFFWAVVYGLVWFFYWRIQESPSDFQILGIQLILMEISAGLAFDVGRHLSAMNNLFEGLSLTTYPNRTLELQKAETRISAELTRSRRYHHPLSLLIFELDKSRYKHKREKLDGLEKDLLQRFAIARIGQIISDGARETDLILRDQAGRFVLLCPETNMENSAVFGDRIRKAVVESMDTEVVWSSASFPDEALTFEELVERAEQRLVQPSPLDASSVSVQTKINTE